MNLVVLGPQGSGKGTQAKLLVKKLGLIHLSTGDLLRRVSREDTALGRQVKELINWGRLVPDKILFQVIETFLTEENFERGLLFDGVPRRQDQAKTLTEKLSAKGQQIDKVFVINISRKESVRRLSARRSCSQCGRIFNLLTAPPAKSDVCDGCGGSLVSRKDDQPEAIEKRLGIYERETLPLVKFYRQKGILEEVDGERPIEVIHKDILGRLQASGLSKK